MHLDFQTGLTAKLPHLLGKDNSCGRVKT